MENNNKKKRIIIALLFLLVFFGAVILFSGFNNIEIEVKDKAEDIVFAEENTTELNCAEKTFKYFNITNKDIEARQLSYLIGQTAQGKTFSKEILKNMTNKTLEAYIFHINCLYNITDTVIITLPKEEKKNQSFESIEDYVHPLEGQIIKMYYSNEDEPTHAPTPSTPAIPEFGSILLPMMLMLASVGRVKI